MFRPKGVIETNKLPVGIYMHGGAFNRGTAKMHDSASMVGWSDEPFIIVSFNYRIGALGFLNSALTQKKGLLNVGLKDQILLMEWVHENVAKFGGNFVTISAMIELTFFLGDPDNVTLFGLSAGAHSVRYCTLKPGSQLTRRKDWTPRSQHQFSKDTIPQSRNRVWWNHITRSPPLRL